VQQGFRINDCRAGGVSVMRLARRLRWTVWFHAVCLYRDSAAIHLDGCQLHRKRFGSARITTRSGDSPKRFCSSSQ